MSNLDEMTFRHFETEAEKGRAKKLAASCMQALKPHLVATLGPLVHPDVNVSELVEPMLRTFDHINSSKREQRERFDSSAASHPPLRVYPR